MVLKDGCVDTEPPRSLTDYVNGFRHRLFVAQEKLCVSQSKMKKLYDRHAERQEFSPGDQVLALMPIIDSPFQVKYTGPYTRC